MDGDIARPVGTVTFLLTDVEGSTRLWEDHPDQMAAALERHDAILRAAIASHDGYVFSTAGDFFAAAFGRASDAIAAAVDAQAGLRNEKWPIDTTIRVRMGVHTGEAEERDGDFFGPAVNRAARIMGAGHGGQILVSAATAELSAAVALVDLGEHRLKDLGSPEHLFQIEADERFPRLRTLSARNNLPVQRTALVGREDEIGRVMALLTESRLVTLTGVGGVGKTRLALAAAARATDRFDDGVFLADLTTLSSGSQVPGVVAEAVGLSLGGEVEDRLLELLGARELLVVLDNCEHLIDDVAEFVDRVLARNGRARLLATSREALEIDGERTFRVPSLSVSAASDSGSAVELLVERATSAGVNLARTAEQDELLREICARLDGIPLAIELAAAQLASLSPVDLLTRLDHRFDLLSGGRRRRRQRQQTLQAVMDWSWDLLDAEEQSLLAHLGVMVGTWGLEDAEGICGPGGAAPVAPTLGSLVSKSLVQPAADGATTRYRLLETVRMYVQQKLVDRAEADELRDRHLWWYVHSLCSGSDTDSLDLRHITHYRRDYENIRSAIDWALATGDHDAAAALVIAGRVQNFTTPVPNPLELVDLAEQLLGVVRDPTTRARLYCTQSWLFWGVASDAERTIESGERASELAREAGDAFTLVQGLAFATFYRNDREHWERTLAEARAVAAESGSAQIEDFVEVFLAGGQYAWSDMERVIEDALDRAERITNTGLAVANLSSLQAAALELGRHDLATWVLDRMEAVQQRLSGFPEPWYDPYHRALIAALDGDTEGARAHVDEARRVEESGRIGPVRGDFLLVPAALAEYQGRVDDCAALLAAVRSNPVPLSGGQAFSVYRALRRRVRAKLTDEQLATARTRGRQLCAEDVLAEI